MSATGNPDLLALAERIAVTAGPGEQIEVYAARGSSTSVRAFEGEVESLSIAESAGVGIRVVAGTRQGFAHCGTLDEAAIAETLADARDNAAFGAEDPCSGLAEPDGVEPVHQELWSDALVSFPTERKVALALDLERAVVARDPRIRGVRTATYGDGAGEAAVATSTGIAVAGRGTICHLSVSALASEGDETTVGVGLDVGRDPGDLDLDRAADEAAIRATRLLGGVPVASQRLPVVFEPRLAATVLGVLGGTLTAERVAKGRSPFADRSGEAIAAGMLTLVDDPTDPRSLGADSHDGEGLACRRNVLVDGGVLQGFLHNTWTARRLAARSTGSAVRSYRSTPGVGCQALAVAPGDQCLEELVAGLDHGLLVQSLTGVHSGINAVTGDISVGAEGLMIRGGELAEPVREVTLASSLQRLLLGIEAVGSDLEWLPGGTGASTLLFDEMVLGGV